jgi:hypothetical protein
VRLQSRASRARRTRWWKAGDRGDRAGSQAKPGCSCRDARDLCRPQLGNLAVSRQSRERPACHPSPRIGRYGAFYRPRVGGRACVLEGRTRAISNRSQGGGCHRGLFARGRGVPADKCFRPAFLPNEPISGCPSLNALLGDTGASTSTATGAARFRRGGRPGGVGARARPCRDPALWSSRSARGWRTRWRRWRPGRRSA